MFDEADHVEEVTTTEQSTPETKPAEQKDHKQEQIENNIRIMRERWEQEKIERERAERRAKELEERYGSASQQKPQQAAPVEEDVPDDEIVDGRTHKKQIQKIRQEFKQELELMRNKTEFESAERSLRDKYADFGSVVNEDNLKTFQAVYPEEYASMMSNANPYARIKTAYTLIANLGIVEKKQPAYDQGKPNRNTAPRAAASSSMVSSPATTPLSHIPDMEGRVVLSKKQMDDIDRETQELVKRYRGGY